MVEILDHYDTDKPEKRQSRFIRGNRISTKKRSEVLSNTKTVAADSLNPNELLFGRNARYIFVEKQVGRLVELQRRLVLVPVDCGSLVFRMPVIDIPRHG